MDKKLGINDESAKSYSIIKPLYKKNNSEIFLIKYNLDKDIKNNIYVLKRIEVKTEEDKKKLAEEVNLLSQINSNYIIKIYSHFYENINEQEFFCVIMDYYEENNNIKNKIIQNFFNSRNVWKFFVEIALGLKSLNEQNTLIDNFTPQNIFIDKNNNYKIGGFGNVLDITKEDEINDNNWKYQSPEILNGEKSDDSSCIWSLGCILYELAFKKTAFNSKENILDIKYEIPEDTENDLNIILKNLLCKKIIRKTIKDLIFDPIFKKKLIEVNLLYENITFDMKSKSK